MLDLGESAGLHTGDAVRYDAGGGAAMGGLRDGTTYYAIEITEGHFQLAATRDDATQGQAITLTDAGNAQQRLIDQSDTMRVEATSGAGGGKIGIAGSVAVNVVNVDTEAVVGANGSASVTIIAGGRRASVTADSDVYNVARALPSAGGGQGTSVGIGASVAINVISNTTEAVITHNTTWAGPVAFLTVAATSRDAVLTHGENGASSDSVAVGVGVAIAVVHDTTVALVGIGSAITAAGDVSVTAAHIGQFSTSTSAEAAGKSVGVGASITVAVVIENTSAELARDINTAGAVTVASSSDVGSDAGAIASVKGEDKNDSGGQTSKNDSSKKGADGQADHQINDNSVTKGGDTSLPSAKDSSDSANSSSDSQSGEDSSGVGVAAAVSVNVLQDSNTASVTHGADLKAQQAVKVDAQSLIGATAKATGSSLAMDNNVNIGAAVGLNVVDTSNRAFVDSGSVVRGDGITIDAVTPQGKSDDFVAWGAAAVGGAGDVAVAGSVAINVIHTFNTEASARAGSELFSSGDITITAAAPLHVQTLAAGVSFSEGTSVGAAVAIAIVNVSVLATIGGTADAAGAIMVDAEIHLTPLKIDVPLLDDAHDPTATSVAVAGGASSGTAGIAGSVVVDDFHLNTAAYVGAGSRINQGGFYAPSSGQSLSVHAVNETVITSIAGGLGVTDGSAGIGASLELEVAHKDTRAYIDTGAVVSTGGAIDIAADSLETVLSVSATLGVGDSAGIAGSASVQVITSDTEAYVADALGGTGSVTAGGALSISADSALKLRPVRSASVRRSRGSKSVVGRAPLSLQVPLSARCSRAKSPRSR